MIVDMLNMYYRAYIVDPSLSSNGQPIGGIKGSLKILQKLCREIRPTQVYICWDGREGSSKRRKINKGYKEGRKPIRLNRSVKNMTEKQEAQNKIWQMIRLAEYFNQLPLCQINIDYSEADDIIGALVKRFKDKEKVIVSSDKDYFQLLDESTLLLRPTQKQILNKNNIEENYKVMNLGTVFLSPQNTRVIKESVENYPLEFARTEFIKMMMQDGFAELNWDDLYSSMNRIRIANAK